MFLISIPLYIPPAADKKYKPAKIYIPKFKLQQQQHLVTGLHPLKHKQKGVDCLT